MLNECSPPAVLDLFLAETSKRHISPAEIYGSARERDLSNQWSERVRVRTNVHFVETRLRHFWTISSFAFKVNFYNRKLCVRTLTDEWNMTPQEQ